MRVSSNFSECVMAPTDTEMYPVSVVALQAAFVFLLITVGNGSLLATIIYEKYGMDPQKRTVTNKMLTSLMILMILFNLSIMPLHMKLKIYGGGLAIRVTILSGWIFLSIFTFLTLAEMTILKLIYITNYSKIAKMNEYFISHMITALNLFACTSFVVIRLVTAEIFNNPWICNNKTFTPLQKSVNFWTYWFPCLASMTIMIIFIPLIVVKKVKARAIVNAVPVPAISSTVQDSNLPSQFNTNANNDSIIGFSGVAIVFVLAGMTVFPSFWFVFYQIRNMKEVLKIYIFNLYSILTMFFPALFFLRKPSRLSSVINTIT